MKFAAHTVEQILNRTNRIGSRTSGDINQLIGSLMRPQCCHWTGTGNDAFDELSMRGFAVWGALGGFAVSLLPTAVVMLGLGTPNVPLWQITVAIAGPFTLGGAIAAAGSLALARWVDDRELLESGQEVADVGLTDAEERELLGSGG